MYFNAVYITCQHIITFFTFYFVIIQIERCLFLDVMKAWTKRRTSHAQVLYPEITDLYNIIAF
jgi:hypothetical protein